MLVRMGMAEAFLRMPQIEMKSILEPRGNVTLVMK
jgi:hypothetical protein